MSKFWKFLPLLFLLVYTTLVFQPFFFSGKLPIPADTIVGLYHPWRDLYSDKFPSGIPYKNYLITDPVRQQLPWRYLAIEQLKQGKLPVWNPYSFSGTPLLGNLQTAALYPLNILYWLLPFAAAWSWQVVLQVVLGGLFMCFYLKNLKLESPAVTLGTLAWVGSGFFIAWLEWNTIVQAAIWLPLLLLAIDEIYSVNSLGSKVTFWIGVLIFSLTSSFLAGHIQIFLYIFLFCSAYVFARIWQTKKIKVWPLFLLAVIVFLIITSVQWLPMLQNYQNSLRTIDNNAWREPGWFLPWQNLAQFLAPDFFGNPATLNYFGIWNYGEFVGYIGVVGLLFSLTAVLFRRDKKTLFFTAGALVALIFALPTPLAWAPMVFLFAQPTRLMVIIDFCLAVLAALGLDHFLKNKRRQIFLPIGLVGVSLAVLWLISSSLHLSVSSRNLYFPTAIFSAGAVLTVLFSVLKRKSESILIFLLLILIFLDLSRFFSKFEAFSAKEYLFPQTKVITFLQDRTWDSQPFRIATVDDRALPPNFASYYHLQTIDGYDSLILRPYANILANMNDDKFPFNRIQTPKNYDSRIFDLLNVRYIISLNDIISSKYSLVTREGETRVYENRDYLPRVFFVQETLAGSHIAKFYSPDSNFRKVALVASFDLPEEKAWSPGAAEVIAYSPLEVKIRTNNSGDGYLVFTDVFYSSWKAEIDGKLATVFLTDEAFRGTIVPKGRHTVRFFSQQ